MLTALLKARICYTETREFHGSHDALRPQSMAMKYKEECGVIDTGGIIERTPLKLLKK